MAVFDKMRLTRKGRMLLNKIHLGEPLTITRPVIGSGYLSEGESVVDLDALKEPANDIECKITRKVLTGDCTAEITMQIIPGDRIVTIRELGLMAQDPDEGEILYCATNAHDYPDFLPAASASSKLSRRTYVLGIETGEATEIVIENITITEVSREEFEDEIAARIEADSKLEDKINSALDDLGNAIISEISIPIGSWTQQEMDAQGYTYYADVIVAAAKEAHFPNVALSKESQSVAAAARICPSVKASDGTLRFWAKLVPADEIKATVALLKSSSDASGGNGGGGYVLPTATKTRLGGVKIGDNISVQPDGTISSSGKLDPSQVATDDEAKQMLDEIFNKKD